MPRSNLTIFKACSVSTLTPPSFPCFSSVQVTGQCLPATLVADTTVTPSGAVDWDPSTYWRNLRAGFKVVYSSAHDSWEQELSFTDAQRVQRAIDTEQFSILWDLTSAPAGSRLTPGAGCSNTAIYDAGANGVSILQKCPDKADVVWPFLTYLGSEDRPASAFAGPSDDPTNGQAMSVKVAADVAGTYVISARWSDGCAFATIPFTLTAACPSLAPALVALPSVAVIPVGNESTWRCITLDASSTAYGTSASSIAALNPRWFLTSAPLSSRFNPINPMLALTTDVDNFPTNRISGWSSYRLGADYSAYSSDSVQVSSTIAGEYTYRLELLGSNGMSVCFLPDVEGSYSASFLAQDFCPLSYASSDVVTTRNVTVSSTFSVTCVGNFTNIDVSAGTRTVTANSTNWTPIPLLPRGASVNVPSASRFVRTFWNMTSAPKGHSWVPLDLSTSVTPSATLQAQYALLRVSNLESVRSATFVPTVAGAYTFVLSVWDPRCPTTMTNRTITINVLCDVPATPSLSVSFLNSNAFKQDNVVSVQLSIAGPAQPVRYSWRTYSSGRGAGAASFFNSAAAAASSSSTPALTQGGIAGVVIGVIVGAVLLLLIIVLVVRATTGKSGRGAVAADTSAAAAAPPADAAPAAASPV
jgi:hypothetical protein